MQTATISRSAPEVTPGKIGVSTVMWTVLAAIAVVTCILMFGLICWGLDRGLDPMVESFYLLSCQSPHLYPTFSSFHLILSKIPHLAANEIIHYRILELIARIIPPIVLALGVTRWLRDRLPLDRARLIFLCAFSLMGGLMASAAFPRSISYNGMSSALAFLAVAFAFFACGPSRVLAASTAEQQPVVEWSNSVESKPPFRLGTQLSWVVSLALVAAGFCVGSELFVKASTALLLFVGLAVLLASQRRALGILLLVAGMALAAAVYFGLVQGPTQWWAEFSDAVAQETQSSHTLAMLYGPIIDLIKLYWLRGLEVVGGAVVFFCFFASGTAKLKRTSLQILAVVVCLVLYTMWRKTYYILHESYGSLFVLTALTAALANSIIVNLKRRERFDSSVQPSYIQLLIGLGFLAVLPFIPTAGTNCNPLLHVCSNMPPWFLLVALGSFVCEKKFSAPYTAPLFALALLTYSGFHFADQSVYKRYECDDLTQQTRRLKGFPVLDGIKLDYPTANFFYGASHILRSNGYREGDPIISFYDLPGLVYVMGGVSPGQAWFVNWPHRDGINAYYLSKADLTKVPRVFLVTSCETCVGPKVLEVLAKQGMPPRSFKLIGQTRPPLPHQQELHYYVHYNPAAK